MAMQLVNGLKQSRAVLPRCAGAWRSFASAAEDGAAEKATDLQAASGMPPLGAQRKVVIFSPSKVAGQHGLAMTIDGNGPGWQVYFEPEQKWANPLMGWTSTADYQYMSYRRLAFDTKEDAIDFAEKRGWAYEVEEPNPRNHKRPTRFIGYGDNFSVKRRGIPEGGLKSEQAPAAAAAAAKGKKK